MSQIRQETGKKILTVSQMRQFECPKWDEKQPKKGKWCPKWDSSQGKSVING